MFSIYKPVKTIYNFIHQNIFIFISVLFAFLTSINTITNKFAYDDLWMFVKNSFIHSHRNLLLVFFTNIWTNVDVPGHFFPYFRPLIAVFHIIEWQLFGKNPALYHFVNVIFHSLVVAILFIFLRKLTDRPKLAFIATTLFAVHPVHAESVAWISGVPDLFVAFFSLSILYIYILYRQSKSWIYLILMTILFSFAIFSKENAFFIIPIVLLLEIYLNESSRLKDIFQRIIRVWGAFSTPVILYLYLRYYSNHGVLFPGESYYPLEIVIMTTPKVFLKYIELLVLPYAYSVHHPLDLVTTFSFTYIILPLFLIIVSIIAVFLYGSRLLVFSTTWFLIWIAPALIMLRAFVAPVYFVQERYLYISSIGFCIITAIFFDWLYKKFRKIRTMKLVFIILVSTLAFIHAKQNLVWHDDFMLYMHNFQVNKNSSDALISLSSEYMQKENLTEAKKLAESARNFDPYDSKIYIYLAGIEYRENNLDKALEHLEQAEIVLKKRYNTNKDIYHIYILIGAYYSEKNEFVRAEHYFRKAIDVENNAFTLDPLGRLYYDQERFAEALIVFKQLKQQSPPISGYPHLWLGKTYQKLQQSEQARQEYKTYLSLAPYGRYREFIQDQLKVINSN